MKRVNNEFSRQAALSVDIARLVLSEQALQQPADGVAAPGVGTLMVIVVPLIQQMIVEGKAAEGGGHELKVRLQAQILMCTCIH